MANFINGTARGTLPRGFSRYPEDNEVNNARKNIANYNPQTVGYQDANSNQYARPQTNNFYQQPRTNFRRNFFPRNQKQERNVSKNRLRRSEEGQWLGPPANTQKPVITRNETPTQTVINGQSNDNCKQLCIRIVGHIRKLKQDHDILSKQDELFKDRFFKYSII